MKAGFCRISVLFITLAAGICWSPFLRAGACADWENPFGVMVHFEREDFYSPQEMEQACKLIKDAGIGWVSTLFEWKTIEPQDGKFDFSLPDRIYEITSRHQLGLLVLLGFSSQWGSSAPQGTTGRDLWVWPPKDVDEFADYVYRTVARYKGKIKYWQIWGEENSSYNWRPAPDAASYLKLLRASYLAAKRADPDCLVVLGSLAPYRMDNYLEELYKLGGKDYFDVVAIDPYTHPLTDYDRYLNKKGKPLELLAQKIKKVKEVMAKFGDSHKPLWVTELGCPGQDEPGKWWLPGPMPSKEEQAAWLRKSFSYLLDSKLADKVFWYNFRTPPDELKAQAGLVDIDFKIKPAYLAYKELISSLKEISYNVLLITVDSLRPDHLGCYGYGRNTTPNIDRLSHRGVVFENAFAQAPWTSAALLSLLTSLYPQVHGVETRDRFLAPQQTTPIEILKEKGYLVPGISYIHTVLNYSNLGFDVVEKPTSWQARDEEYQLIDWLQKNHKQRFFLWHHFYAPHLPYDPPSPFDKFYRELSGELSGQLQEKIKMVRSKPVLRKGSVEFKKGELPFIIALYDGEIRFTDAQIGRVLDKLEELNLMEKTIIVITADHGEEFLEHGFLGHASTSLAGTLYDEVLRIPLIIYHPAWHRKKIISHPVEALDIMPTVFQLLSIEPPAGLFQGKSLVGLIESGIPYKNRTFATTDPGGYQSPEGGLGRLFSIRTDAWKLVYSLQRDSFRYELYNLIEDPLEKNNVIKKNPEIFRRLKSQLDNWILLCQQRRRYLEALASARQPAEGPVPEDIGRPVILLPRDGDMLIYQKETGRVVISWQGRPDLVYDVEYEIGKGDYHIKGSFPVLGNRQAFGPLPPDVWDLLEFYNPFRFRVCLQGRPDTFSEWVEFSFKTTEKSLSESEEE
jgi:arylsulfatase A-like enzyme